MEVQCGDCYGKSGASGRLAGKGGLLVVGRRALEICGVKVGEPRQIGEGRTTGSMHRSIKGCLWHNHGDKCNLVHREQHQLPGTSGIPPPQYLPMPKAKAPAEGRLTGSRAGSLLPWIPT